MRATRLEIATAALYDAFSSYTHPGSDFCAWCYSPGEINRYTTTPLQNLGKEDCRVLLWECFDHWESPDVYRHYLPRLLEAMGPPLLVEEIYPGHLSETLRALSFLKWPKGEQAAVIEFLKALTPYLKLYDAEDQSEWNNGLVALGAQPRD